MIARRTLYPANPPQHLEQSLDVSQVAAFRWRNQRTEGAQGPGTGLPWVEAGTGPEDHLDLYLPSDDHLLTKKPLLASADFLKCVLFALGVRSVFSGLWLMPFIFLSF